MTNYSTSSAEIAAAAREAIRFLKAAAAENEASAAAGYVLAAVSCFYRKSFIAQKTDYFCELKPWRHIFFLGYIANEMMDLEGKDEVKVAIRNLCKIILKRERQRERAHRTHWGSAT